MQITDGKDEGKIGRLKNRLYWLRFFFKLPNQGFVCGIIKQRNWVFVQGLNCVIIQNFKIVVLLYFFKRL